MTLAGLTSTATAGTALPALKEHEPTERARHTFWPPGFCSAVVSAGEEAGRGGGILLCMHAVLHHLGWEDLRQQDVQGRCLVVPIVSIIVTAPRLQLVVELQAFLEVCLLLQQTPL